MQRTRRTPRKNHRRRLPRCLYGAMLTISASASVAQLADDAGSVDGKTTAPRYTVEIILFAYREDVAAGGEVFPPDEPALAGGMDEAAIEDSVDAGEFDGRPVPEFSDRLPAAERRAGNTPTDEELGEIVLPANIELSLLSREQLRLGAEYDKLVKLDAYDPVLWAGWSQTTFGRDVTPEIRLRRLGRAPLTYDGSFKLYLSRFLHLDVELAMAATGNASVVPRYDGYYEYRDDDDRRRTPASGAVHYRISEERIVKNGDLRYFDHPKFGLLARVTRVEDAAARPNDSEAPLEQ